MHARLRCLATLLRRRHALPSITPGCSPASAAAGRAKQAETVAGWAGQGAAEPPPPPGLAGAASPRCCRPCLGGGGGRRRVCAARRWSRAARQGAPTLHSHAPARLPPHLSAASRRRPCSLCGQSRSSCFSSALRASSSASVLAKKAASSAVAWLIQRRRRRPSDSNSSQGARSCGRAAPAQGGPSEAGGRCVPGRACESSCGSRAPAVTPLSCPAQTAAHLHQHVARADGLQFA